MKKTFRIIGMAMMAVLLSVSLAACGGDNEEDLDDPDDPGTSVFPENPSTDETGLTGTWFYSEKEADWSSEVEMTFKSNGDFYLVERGIDDGEEYTWWNKGFWKADDRFIYVTIESTPEGPVEDGPVTETWLYTIKGNKLILEFPDETITLTKKK